MGSNQYGQLEKDVVKAATIIEGWNFERLHLVLTLANNTESYVPDFEDFEYAGGILTKS